LFFIFFLIFPGRFTTNNQKACSKCPLGFFSEQSLFYDDTKACLTCPVGYQPKEDRSACVFCQTGEYTSKDRTCKKCDANQYVNNATNHVCQHCEGLKRPTKEQNDCELDGVAVFVIFLFLGLPMAMFSAIVNGGFGFFLFFLLGLPAVALVFYWKKYNNDDDKDTEEFETFWNFYETKCCARLNCFIKCRDQLIMGGKILTWLIVLGFVGIVLFCCWHRYKELDEYTEEDETMFEFYKTRLSYIRRCRCCIQPEDDVVAVEMANPIKTYDPLEQAQWKIKPSQLVIGKRIGAGGCVSTFTGLFLVPCLGHVYFLCKAPSHQVVFVLSFFVVFDCLLFLGMGLRRYIGWFGCIRPHCLQRSDFSDH
jgi:hypothetical protein